MLDGTEAGKRKREKNTKRREANEQCRRLA
jgi:hypothetical protein